MSSWDDSPYLVEDFEVFVRAIVKNKKRELLRKLRVRMNTEVLMPEPEQYSSTNDKRSKAIRSGVHYIRIDRHVYEFHDEKLYAAIMQLDDAERTVILMRDLAQWSVGEIAKLQGVIPKTVYNRRERGLAFLRKRLRCSDTEGIIGADEQDDPGSSKRRPKCNPSGP